MLRRIKKYIKYALGFYIIWQGFVLLAQMADWQWWRLEHVVGWFLLLVLFGINFACFFIGKEEGDIRGYSRGWYEGRDYNK